MHRRFPAHCHPHYSVKQKRDASLLRRPVVIDCACATGMARIVFPAPIRENSAEESYERSRREFASPISVINCRVSELHKTRRSLTALSSDIKRRFSVVSFLVPPPKKLKTRCLFFWLNFHDHGDVTRCRAHVRSLIWSNFHVPTRNVCTAHAQIIITTLQWRQQKTSTEIRSEKVYSGPLIFNMLRVLCDYARFAVNYTLKSIICTATV